MKKYATVDTEKSARIFTSALTWFLLRTVPSSRNANPACIASTMIAPSKMNSASLLIFKVSMRFLPFMFSWQKSAMCMQSSFQSYNSSEY